MVLSGRHWQIKTTQCIFIEYLLLVCIRSYLGAWSKLVKNNNNKTYRIWRREFQAEETASVKALEQACV